MNTQQRNMRTVQTLSERKVCAARSQHRQSCACMDGAQPVQYGLFAISPYSLFAIVAEHASKQCAVHCTLHGMENRQKEHAVLVLVVEQRAVYMLLQGDT